MFNVSALLLDDALLKCVVGSLVIVLLQIFSIEMPLGADTRGPKEPFTRMMVSRYSKGRRNLGVVQPTENHC